MVGSGFWSNPDAVVDTFTEVLNEMAVVLRIDPSDAGVGIRYHRCRQGRRSVLSMLDSVGHQVSRNGGFMGIFAFVAIKGHVGGVLRLT